MNFDVLIVFLELFEMEIGRLEDLSCSILMLSMFDNIRRICSVLIL